MLSVAETNLAEHVAEVCITNYFEELLLKLEKIDQFTLSEIVETTKQLQAAKDYPENTFGKLDDEFSQAAYERSKDICRLIIRTRLTKLKKRHTVLLKDKDS